MKVSNIAFYKFFRINPADLSSLRRRLRTLGQDYQLRGTVILAPEGINGFIAGECDQVRAFQSQIKDLFQIQDLEFKLSLSDQVPFKRLKIKLKKEIIPFGLPDIHPDLETGQRLMPETLRAWLNEGRPLWLVDTRNDYEIKDGTFKDAVDLDLKTFREFPERWKSLATQLDDRPIVMFCTGGIRCEKATAFAAQFVKNPVYQLEGGILKYFEKVGSDYFNGTCFIFDEREALDSHLQPQSTRP